MAERIFFLNKVRDGVSVDAAEQFLRSRDIPMAATVPSIKRYSVVRVDGWVSGAGDATPYDFIDVLDLSSVDDYRRDIKQREGTPDWDEFVQEWSQYIGDAVAVHGHELDELPHTSISRTAEDDHAPL